MADYSLLKKAADAASDRVLSGLPGVGALAGMGLAAKRHFKGSSNPEALTHHNPGVALHRLEGLKHALKSIGRDAAGVREGLLLAKLPHLGRTAALYAAGGAGLAWLPSVLRDLKRAAVPAKEKLSLAYPGLRKEAGVKDSLLKFWRTKGAKFLKGVTFGPAAMPMERASINSHSGDIYAVLKKTKDKVDSATTPEARRRALTKFYTVRDRAEAIVDPKRYASERAIEGAHVRRGHLSTISAEEGDKKVRSSINRSKWAARAQFPPAFGAQAVPIPVVPISAGVRAAFKRTGWGRSPIEKLVEAKGITASKGFKPWSEVKNPIKVDMAMLKKHNGKLPVLLRDPRPWKWGKKQQ